MSKSGSEVGKEQLTVIAKFRAKPGMESRLRDLLHSLTGPTRLEDGCINYDLHESAEDPAAFALYENWTSTAHLETHLKAPHLEKLFKAAPELIQGEIEITRWRMLP